MRIVLALALTAFSSLVAQTADAEVYAGFNIGQFEHTSSNRNNTGFNVFAAVRLTDRILLEGGPVYPGRLRDNEPVTKGFSIQALGLFPVGEKYDFFIKGGLYDWEVERRTVKFYAGRDPMVGIGAHRYISNDFALRVELNRLSGVRSGDVDWISIGFIRWFRELGN